MDNYKIINTHTNEIITALNDLGYVWTPKKFDEQDCLLKAHWILAKEKGGIAYSSGTHIDSPLVFTELTLPQLRDLVVLKRNDVKDATHEDQYGDKWLYLDERHYVYLNYQWSLPTGEFLERYELKPIEKSQPQDPALIGGADALRALADGKEVEGFSEENEEWIPIVYFSVQEVVNGLYKFRLKPQTIKLELELPKPFEPEEDCHVYILDDGKTDGYRRYSYEVHGDKGNTFIGIWRTEEEIKQVVEQLRKIRGTNS
ncbi:hypothetical protein [Acinetobacter baumannii]